MLNSKRILAVIQARGGSKGIPRKNIYPIDGHPLIAYTIEAAKGSQYVDRLVVSTDSDEIADVSRRYGADTPFTRPAGLSGDTVLSVDSLMYAARESENYYGAVFDIIVELPCVSPLRNSADIDAALEKLVGTGANSVISVVNTGEKHPIRLKRIVDDQILDFCNEYPEPAAGSRRQDFEPCYIRNGAIYSMTRHTLLELGSRHGPDSRPYEMPEERSLNIDGWMDLRIVDLMVRDGQCSNRPRITETFRVEGVGRVFGPRVLVTAPLYFMPLVREKIIEGSNCVLAHGASAETVTELLADAEGWLCSPSPVYRIDEKILARASKLKVIATPSTGSNHIDKEYCERKGIRVISLKGSSVIDQVFASSEFSFALLLAVMRKLPSAFNGARGGLWRDAEERYRGVELAGKTLGLIGYGRIGRNMSRYASAMGMKVRAFDPHVKISDGLAIQESDPRAVLAVADVVAICVHLDDSTQAMVDAGWFAAMKDGAYFVNTSRGEVIDESALLDALRSGKLTAAGVDVISNEQQPDLRNHPLVKYAKANENLIVTPHIAGLTVESETKTALYAFGAVLETLGATRA
jgi:phosphoglycerate dehydrogenase-like enzyme/CMP-N-acetylneuraminic acid synthetase